MLEGDDATMEHIPPSLEQLDDNEQCREVYAWAGLALYQAQVIEHGLVNAILVVRLAEDSDFASSFSDGDHFFAEHFQRTMGQLMKRLRKHLTIDATFDHRLDDLLRRRNFVIHNFFRERAELFMHQEGRAIMLDELASFVDGASGVEEELARLVLDYGAAHGLSAERIGAELDRLTKSSQPPG